MTSRWRFAASVVCFAGAVALHAAQDRIAPAPSVDRPDILFVRSPTLMKRLTLGNAGLAADVYWIRALQHFGAERLSPPSHVRTYALLYPLLDLTTSLDPYFNIAYRFGAIFLGEPYPGGPGRPDLAVALLQKGIAAQPDKWQYMQDLGFVYYWHLHDYQTAAEWFERAAAVPGAPNWMRPLAATTLAEGGKRGASRELWEAIAQSDEPWLRTSAAQRLSQLDAMDDIDAIEKRVDAFRRVHPGAAVSWEALTDARVLPGVPLDPSGTPFVIDPATGRITVSNASKLFPLPGQLSQPQ
ncbi:MAG: hypothetical protein ACRD1V_10890 [Vicinamibacterales bacterium]